MMPATMTLLNYTFYTLDSELKATLEGLTKNPIVTFQYYMKYFPA